MVNLTGGRKYFTRKNPLHAVQYDGQTNQRRHVCDIIHNLLLIAEQVTKNTTTGKKGCAHYSCLCDCKKHECIDG